MIEVQEQLPLIVELGRPVLRFRPTAYQRAALDQLKEQTGFSMMEIVRRSLHVVHQEMKLTGDCDFLMPLRTRPSSGSRGGRKPNAKKAAELQESIQRHLRALAREQRELAALEQKQARVA